MANRRRQPSKIRGGKCQSSERAASISRCANDQMHKSQKRGSDVRYSIVRGMEESRGNAELKSDEIESAFAGRNREKGLGSWGRKRKISGRGEIIKGRVIGIYFSSR